MRVGVITGSSGRGTATIKPDVCGLSLSSGRAGRGGGVRVSLVSVRPGAVPLRKRWGSLRAAPSSSPATVSGSFRARAAVEGGVLGAVVERKSFYELLGIPRGGTITEIKRAYKEMARRYHPDVCPSPERTEEYTRRFIEVQEAYETLSDPSLRACYDRDLARGLHLAFSARRRTHHHCDDEDLEEKTQWRNRWQDQVAVLKRRSAARDSGNTMSWAARMRRQRAESPEQ